MYHPRRSLETKQLGPLKVRTDILCVSLHIWVLQNHASVSPGTEIWKVTESQCCLQELAVPEVCTFTEFHKYTIPFLTLNGEHIFMPVSPCIFTLLSTLLESLRIS